MKLYCKDNGISYGVIGKRTPLSDKDNNTLFVGDVVIMRHKASSHEKICFVAYDHQTDRCYIMGNFLNNPGFEYELAISHEKLHKGFRIGNVGYTND